MVHDHSYDPCVLEDALYMHTWAVITRIRVTKNETSMRIWAGHVGDILGVEGRKGKVNVILFCCMSSWYSNNKNSLKISWTKGAHGLINRKRRSQSMAICKKIW